MTFKQTILDSFEFDELKSIEQHGCASACLGGYIYYHETTAAYDRHKEEIWDCLNEIMESVGCKTPLELIASFNGSKNVYSDYQFKNLLVWFYIEEVARQYIDSKECEE